jgi:hypothetical protein
MFRSEHRSAGAPQEGCDLRLRALLREWPTPDPRGNPAASGTIARPVLASPSPRLGKRSGRRRRDRRRRGAGCRRIRGSSRPPGRRTVAALADARRFVSHDGDRKNTMSHKWIISLVAAVLAGAVAYGVTRSTACGRSAQSVDRLQDISFLPRELDLSDAQVKVIKNLHTTLGAKLTDSCTRHCADRMRLGRAVADETNGMIHAEAALTAMCLAYEQSERDTLTHILAVRALLNNEQKRRFEEMISECLCRPCKRQGCACMPEAGKRQTGRPRWIIRSRKSGPDRCRSRKWRHQSKAR